MTTTVLSGRSQPSAPLAVATTPVDEAADIASVLRSYPQTEAFEAITHAQLDGDGHPHELLAITELYENDRIALLYFVTEDGHANDVRHVHDWADQNARSKRLSKPDMHRVQAALARLPVAVRSPPPIERLVIISFHDGPRWVTRIYDSAALPEAMREIYGLIGERAETKHRHGRA